MVTALFTLAYLDPGNDNTPVWQLAVMGVIGIAVLLAALYVLVRFAVWAARRKT